MKNVLLLGLSLLLCAGLSAQTDLFTPSSLKSADLADFEMRATPTEASHFALANPSALATLLAKAPTEDNFTAGEELLLVLPNPSGEKRTFQITRYQMITEELQAVYPSFITAYGWDVEAPHRKVFLEWTETGFGASITGGDEGRWFVEPTFRLRTDAYQSFYTQDCPSSQQDATCGFVPNPEFQAEMDAFHPSGKAVGDCELREYDLALACTGEYFMAVGNTQALAVAEMIRAINRVNEVFRADLAITLKLINLPDNNNNVQLVFSNPATDPYTNDDGGDMLDENQTTVDNVIGSANYDIGHVFSTGGGGVASLESPCSNSTKARGVTGLPNPVGDPFYIDFVAHEIGHQFGGRHTFNSLEGNCAQRSSTTAYEPGGGTTIQAYAGICGATANVQQNSDPYYHALSIQEISSYMEIRGGSGCANGTNITTNSAPTVGAGGDFTIPTNTPFVLTAVTSTDPNGDALTYCWEQFDLGPVVAGEPTGSETTGPLFRSQLPVASTERYFPSLPSVVSGTTSWESLPLVARNMTFIVTVRDFGAAGYGCTVQDQMDVTVVNTGSQYAVQSPNGGETLMAGATENVTWNVAGTDVNGINCSTVEIVLSTDGGASFTESLGTFPNNGSASVNLPTSTTSTARIMVRCDGNIFFDISDADFSIEATEFSFSGNSTMATTCSGEDQATFTVDVGSTQGYTGSIDLSVTSGLPAGATATFSTDPVVFSAGNVNTTETITLTISNLAGAADGEYTIVASANDGATTETTELSLNIGAGNVPLGAPANNSQVLVSDANPVVFNFTTVPGFEGYLLNYTVMVPGGGSASGSSGFTFGGDPGAIPENISINLSGLAAEGRTVTWTITASDNDGGQPNLVSCERIFTFVNVLPVNWLSFTAQPSGKTALLNWSVEQDALNAGFAIERSPSEANNWRQIGYEQRVGADGTARYQFTDEQVAAGNTYLYRLRQEDVDGATSYSEIRTVTFGEVIGLIAVPNPTNDFVILNTGSAEQDNLRYSMYDPAGRKVSEGQINGGQTRVDMHQLPAAIYQVLVTDGSGYREVIRVVKR